MNRNFALTLVSACIAAGPAFADDITVDPQPFVSTLTRAEVKEELSQFRHSGVNPWADEYNQMAQSGSTSTRAEVQARYLASRDEVSAFTGEDSGSAYMSRMAESSQPPMSTLAKGK